MATASFITLENTHNAGDAKQVKKTIKPRDLKPGAFAQFL